MLAMFAGNLFPADIKVSDVPKLRTAGDSLAFLGTYIAGGVNKTRIVTFKDIIRLITVVDSGLTNGYATGIGLRLAIGGVHNWHLSTHAVNDTDRVGHHVIRGYHLLDEAFPNFIQRGVLIETSVVPTWGTAILTTTANTRVLMPNGGIYSVAPIVKSCGTDSTLVLSTSSSALAALDEDLASPSTGTAYFVAVPNGTSRDREGVISLGHNESGRWVSEYDALTPKAVINSANEVTSVAALAVGSGDIAINAVKNIDFSPNSRHSIDLVRGVVYGTNSNMSGANEWASYSGTPTFDINSTVPGKMFINFSTGAQGISLDYATTSKAETYYYKIKARINTGAGMTIRIGSVFATGTSDSVSSFTPTGTETTFSGTILSSSVGSLYLYVIAANNNGTDIEIDDVEVYKTGSLVQYADSLDTRDDLDSVQTNIYGRTYDHNQTFAGSGDWVTGIGSPTFNINSTVAGKLFINFSTGNQAVKLPKCEIGHSYRVRLKVRLNSGTATTLKIGKFVSGGYDAQWFNIVPTATETEYTGTLTAMDAVDFYIGVLTGNNNGSDYEVDDVRLYELHTVANNVDSLLNAIASLATYGRGQSFNTTQFMQSLSLYDKPLTKIGMFGNSLFANALGDTVAGGNDSTYAERPPRMGYFNFPRRVFDYLKTNYSKPKWRRIDHTDWKKDAGWAVYNLASIWEPIHSNSKYGYTQTKNDTASITVPNGYEHFALIVMKDDTTFGKNNTDSLQVELNNGDISAYGETLINTQRARLTATDLGNPYYTIIWDSLPAGDNRIRITHQGTNETLAIWGGFYWTGQALAVYNVAHGGHSMEELMLNHYTSEVSENDFDAIILEYPVINDVSKETIANSVQYFNAIIDSTAGKDVLFMSCPPCGTDPRDGDPNNYGLYTDPTMETLADTLTAVAWATRTPWINVFDFFQKKIENKGGTLEGGQGGYWYTWDGEHPNEAGLREWFNILKSCALINKPITF